MKKSTNVKITGILCGLTLFAAGVANAQVPVGNGLLSGSFETNTTWYVPDDAVYNLTNRFPEDRIGSNNYLKLDYTLGKFSAGIQYELYAPALQGYDVRYKDSRLTNKYVSWVDDNFSVTVGDFYDQYGSGLIFRSYEDRALGFNNSIEGAKFTYNIGDVFAVRAMLGRPRLYMGYSSTWLRGADASLALSSLLGFESDYLAIEGSFLSKYDKNRLQYTYEDADGHRQNLLSANMNAWSARLVYETSGFSGRVELVGKSPDKYLVDGVNEAIFGRGQLIELGYSGNGFGISLVGRRLNHMDMTIQEGVNEDLGLSNVLNYVPALTRQYTYSLANLDPYQVKPEGETAGQLDFFYNVRKGSKVGGRYGLKLHLNASVAYSPEYLLSYGNPDELGKNKFANLDASFDVEKQWDKRLKTTAMVAFQRMKGKVAQDLFNRYVIVADVLYKFTPKQSLRVELQYLVAPMKEMSENDLFRDSRDNGDWWAAMAEYSFAPRFSIFASDMYNYKTEKVHYYNVGMSYTQARTRIALSYGRNREGMVCSGGVCRQMPGYTGVNLSLTTSF